MQFWFHFLPIITHSNAKRKSSSAALKTMIFKTPSYKDCSPSSPTLNKIVYTLWGKDIIHAVRQIGIL